MSKIIVISDMGFRSTMVTDEARIGFMFPIWFRDKHSKRFNADSFPISSKVEMKFYEPFIEQEIFVDIQKVMIEQGDDFPKQIVAILLHECGGITRVCITKDSITGQEPIGWNKVEEVQHCYCYGCSDLEKKVV